MPLDAERIPSRSMAFTETAVWRDWGPDEAGAANEARVARVVAAIEPSVAPLPLRDPAPAHLGLGPHCVGWTRAGSSGPGTGRELGSLLARLHAQTGGAEVLAGLREAGGLVQAARSVARATGVAVGDAAPAGDEAVVCSPDERRVLVAAYDRLEGDRLAKAGTGGGGGRRVLVHGDAVVENTLRTEAGVVLVDWEEAGTGPAWVDLAPIVARWRHYGAPPGAVLALFDAYQEAGGIIDAPVDDPVWRWRAEVYALNTTANACARRGRGGDPYEAAVRLAYWARGSGQRWTVQ